MSPVGDMEAPQPRPTHLRSVRQDSYIDWDEVYVDNVSRTYPLMYVGIRPDAEDLTAKVFVAALGPLRIEASPCRQGGRSGWT